MLHSVLKVAENSALKTSMSELIIDETGWNKCELPPSVEVLPDNPLSTSGFPKCKDGWDGRPVGCSSLIAHPSATHPSEKPFISVKHAVRMLFTQDIKKVDLTLSVLIMIKHTITGRHRVTVALRGLSLLLPFVKVPFNNHCDSC
jgi:hypothetical protein